MKSTAKYAARFLALLLMILPAMANAGYEEGSNREFSVFCNGVPCVMDSTNYAVYCSIKPVEGDSMKVVFTTDKFEKVRINYKRYNVGDTITLVNKFTKSYVFHMGVKLQKWTLYFTSMPLVMIDADAYEHDVYHDGYITVVDPWKRTKDKVLYQHFIGARIRGAHTAGLAKKPYAIKIWDGNREGKNVSVLGLMKDDNLILDAMYNDKARMRTRLCFDLWNQVDSLPYEVSEGHSKVNGTQGLYAEVFVNGQYNGVYCITDKINRKKLDLEKVAIDESGNLVFKGMLYKATGWSDETTFRNVNTSANTTNTLWWQEWEQKYPDDSVQMANWTPLRDLLKISTTGYNPNNVLFFNVLRRRYYLQNLVDFVLFINVMRINDNNCKNTYISFRDVTQSPSRALMTPWDLDASIGRNWDGSKFDYQGFGSWLSNCGLFDRLVNNGPEYFKRELHDTWIRWKNGAFSLDSVTARILDKKDQLVNSGAWGRENLRWPGSMENYETETQYMIDWYSRAIANADEALADFPSGIGDVQYSANSDIIVYSSDGMVCIDGNPQDAEISIFTADGTTVESTSAQLPYRCRVPAKGIYIATVKTSHATVRSKILVK